MQVYMIKNTITGQYFRKQSYSSGNWSDTGDVWSEKRHIKNLLKSNAFLLGKYAPVDPFVVVLVQTSEIVTWQPAAFV